MGLNFVNLIREQKGHRPRFQGVRRPVYNLGSASIDDQTELQEIVPVRGHIVIHFLDDIERKPVLVRIIRKHRRYDGWHSRTPMAFLHYIEKNWQGKPIALQAVGFAVLHGGHEAIVFEYAA